MIVISQQNASDLQRIFQEETGRTISVDETHAIWQYLIKLLQLLWNVKHKPGAETWPDQLSLFD